MLTATQREEAESIWIALEAEIAEPGIMCSWDWTGTWLSHYGDVVPHRFVLAERDGVPRGIALVTEPVLSSRLRTPTIALGTTGEPPGSSVFVERNRLLAGDGDRREFASALMAELEGDRHWQRVRFDGMTVEEAGMLLGDRTDVNRRTDESPVADLTAGDGQDVLTALPANKRKRVHQSLHRLGALETQWAQSPGEADSMLTDLIALHTERWQAQAEPGAFASVRFTAFHRDLVARLLPSERVALYRVRRNGETIGCLYGLIEGSRMLFYQGGLRRFDDNRLRVGIAAHALFMQACRDRGFSKYDFLAPSARYKSDLATSAEQLVWAEFERPGARLRLERIGRRVRRTVAR